MLASPSRSAFAASRRLLQEKETRTGLRLLRNEAPLACAIAFDLYYWLGDGLVLHGAEARSLFAVALSQGLRSYRACTHFDVMSRIRCFVQEMLRAAWERLRRISLRSAGGATWQLEDATPLSDWWWQHRDEGPGLCVDHPQPTGMSLDRFSEVVLPRDIERRLRLHAL